MARPFGWLVVAEPSELIDTEIAELRTQLNVLRRYDEEHSRFDAEPGRAPPRRARRVPGGRALERAGAGRRGDRAGTAADRPGAGRLRRPRCAPVPAAQRRGAPRPCRRAGAKLADPVDGAQVPFAATAGALAALDRPAARRGARRAGAATPASFDVTSETMNEAVGAERRDVGGRRSQGRGSNRSRRDPGRPGPAGRHVPGAAGHAEPARVRHRRHRLGQVADGPAHARAADRGRHLVAGRSSRSSPSTRPWPAGSPRTATSRSSTRPTRPAVPLSVNPLAPEPGYPVQAHIDMVRALFLAAFDASEPFPQIISQALQRAYEACGWDPVTGGGQPGALAAPACSHSGAAAACGARGDRGRRLRPGTAGRRSRFR